MKLEPEDIAYASERAQKRVSAALVANDLWEYNDFPGAISSHGIGYTTFAIAGPDGDELVAAAVQKMARAKELGAEFIAWRRGPKLSQMDETGGWKLTMRFHLLPKDVNDTFWAETAAKPEGAPVPALEATT
jgi:hypothetical protein